MLVCMYMNDHGVALLSSHFIFFVCEKGLNVKSYYSVNICTVAYYYTLDLVERARTKLLPRHPL